MSTASEQEYRLCVATEYSTVRYGKVQYSTVQAHLQKRCLVQVEDGKITPAQGVSRAHEVRKKVQRFLDSLLGPLHGRLLDIQKQHAYHQPGNAVP